jgi:hypothetical protein
LSRKCKQDKSVSVGGGVGVPLGPDKARNGMRWYYL